MKYLLTFIILSLTIVVFAQNQIQIKQIESDDQVILRYNIAKNYLWGISIPFEYEVVYKDKKSKEIWIFDGSHYVPEEFDKLRDYGGQGGWQVVSVKLKIRNQLIIPIYAQKNVLPDTCYYWVGTVHNLQPDSDIQDSLAVYVQQIRDTKVESLPVGTLSEFKAKHPQLIHRLLKNDSIEFRIYKKPFKYVEAIALPVKY